MQKDKMTMDLATLSNEEIAAFRRQTVNRIARYHNLQLAKKIQLNSAYGALG